MTPDEAELDAFYHVAVAVIWLGILALMVVSVVVLLFAYGGL
jgi:hypothetical protein